MTTNNTARVNEILDVSFFERCFFGKKLIQKDQVIFNIYAKELLDMIKAVTKKKKKNGKKVSILKAANQFALDRL
jgi:hypothetical protein